MTRILFILTLALSIPPVRAEQFVSLTLCSDRLLMEIARPEQIAAMSPYSTNPLMMLDKTNTSKPTLEPNLIALLPYLDKTILLNTLFYPRLADDLARLGVKVIAINDNPQTPSELFALIRQLGNSTANSTQAEKLIARLHLQNFSLNQPLGETLILSETGLVDSTQPQYQTLFDLLKLSPIKMPHTHLSLENILLRQPNWLISITDKQSYNEQAELLNHPILQKIFANRPPATLPMKYTYCFDHGVWQGAELISQQYHNLQKRN